MIVRPYDRTPRSLCDSDIDYVQGQRGYGRITTSTLSGNQQFKKGYKILIKNQSPPSGMESQLDLIPLSDAFQLSYR